MQKIPVYKHRLINWMLEDDRHGPGRGCPLVHNDLTEFGIDHRLLAQLLAQPWMVQQGENRMWAEDRDELMNWLVEHEILSAEQRLWLDAKHVLALMEG